MFKRIIFILILIVVSNRYVLSNSLKECEKNYLLGDTNNILKNIDNIPSYPRKYYLIGLLYIRRGEYENAQEYFSKIVKLFPNSYLYTLSYIKIGDTLLMQDKLKEAEDVYLKVLNGNKDKTYYPYLYLRLAQVYFKEGEWNKKDYYLNLILNNYPQSIEYYLAKILKKRDNYFYVQVGAFFDKNNAYQIMSELKDKFPVYIKEEVEGRKKIFKVCVGKFSQRKEALKVYNKLLDLNYSAILYP